MATRNLPGVYVSLNDLSQIPEGQTALTVGYVLKAKKGPVGEPTLVTSPDDFLAKFTFTGKPSISDDPTYWDILKVLKQTNQMYVVRAAKNPLYGGAQVESEVVYGEVISASTENKQIVVDGAVELQENEHLMLVGAPAINGYYTVDSTVIGSGITTITVKEEVSSDFVARVQVLSMAVVEDIIGYEPVYTYTITLEGDYTERFQSGKTFSVEGCSVEGNNKAYTCVNSTYDEGTELTTIVVEEELENANDGFIWFRHAELKKAPVIPFAKGYSELDTGIVNNGDSFIVAGVNPGAYNNDISIGIVSSIDNPEALVYYKGADLGEGITCTFDTVQLTVYRGTSPVETFVFSKDPTAKTIDGESLYIEDVVTGSNYIQVINNENNMLLPPSTISNVLLSGGSDGENIAAEDLVRASEVFRDKTVDVSILGNGSSVEAESPEFQQALLEIATERKDVVVFLNSRGKDEKAMLPSERAEAIVDYKKNQLSSVTFFGTMYAPHVKTTDIYNSRQVKVGSSSIAIAGWLNVINTLNYPYAYAGPQNGQVVGVTTDWKIGDMSGEATLMNNASVNYIAFDSKVGRYYMQCQNTLQIANSSLRNLGAVLNVLDIKEHFQTSLKEYLQLPITNSLRRDIVNTANDYLEPMNGVRFYNYVFQDVSSDMDIADNTLRYLLTLSLTAYAQKIYLVMNIVNNTFDFSILQSL